jgi:hypothetical protein
MTFLCYWGAVCAKTKLFQKGADRNRISEGHRPQSLHEACQKFICTIINRNAVWVKSAEGGVRGGAQRAPGRPEINIFQPDWAAPRGYPAAQSGGKKSVLEGQLPTPRGYPVSLQTTRLAGDRVSPVNPACCSAGSPRSSISQARMVIRAQPLNRQAPRAAAGSDAAPHVSSVLHAAWCW